MSRLLTPWRLLFLASAVLLLIGGPQHPRGSMAEMLADPAWVPSHLLQLGSYIALLVGLLLFARSDDLPSQTRRWLRLAIVGTGLMVAEMVLHTAAMVDHAALVAGESTPVLTTHLWMSMLFYPAFAITTIGFLIVSTRERTLGSPWILWLGVVGLVAHGAAPPLVVGLGLTGARILFPMVMLFAFWMVLAAVWPSREAERA